MDNFDIPIFKKAYDLYKMFCGYRLTFPKQDRHTICQRCENCILDILENILLASQTTKSEKLPILEKTSAKLNLLRVFVRLMKETRAIDSKKYIVLETCIDEIGRILGGWIRSNTMSR